MALFPLPTRPHDSYHVPPRAFRSQRDNGHRLHAGCDLYAPPGTPVLAIEDGMVTLGPYLFYDVVYAIEVSHASGMVRYGEISHVAWGVKAGVAVKAGQIIAYVGKMKSVAQSMLHFEMYSGASHGQLTDLSCLPYLRRADLVDPTAVLDACELATPDLAAHPAMPLKSQASDRATP